MTVCGLAEWVDHDAVIIFEGAGGGSTGGLESGELCHPLVIDVRDVSNLS